MCTSIYQVTLDHTHLLARTMDWPILAVSPLFVPRQFKWATAFDHRIYTNKYAMVGGGSLSATRIDVSDGVNEHGLMAQKLTCLWQSNGTKRLSRLSTTPNWNKR